MDRRLLRLGESRRRQRAAAVYFTLLERLRVNPIARVSRIAELHVAWERRGEKT
jgi:hypothetical protein